jgi:hypothetical protein
LQPYHELWIKALAKAKKKKELEAHKAFMKTPLPDINSFKKPFAATILREVNKALPAPAQ